MSTETKVPGTSTRGHAAARESQKRWILQLGQDQLTEKATYYGRELEAFGLSTFYFAQDRSGLSAETIAKHSLAAEIVPRNLLAHWWRYLTLLKRLRPVHLELYLSLKPWTLFFYVACARLFHIPILAWCRGEISNWETHHPLRRWANVFALRSAEIVLLRELYMPKILEKHRVVDAEKTRLVPNSIPLGEEPEYERPMRVLFLNSFKAWRHPVMIVDAASIVAKQFPDVQFRFVGATSTLPGYSPAPDSVEEEIRARTEKYGLENHVEILPFSSNPENHFGESAVFVLPADLVFCNYALLEAMGSGVVPIIADVEGSDRIIDDGVSGFIVEPSAEQIAEKIILLLKDPELRKTLARNAREKIRRDYNSAETAKTIAELCSEHVWRAKNRDQRQHTEQHERSL